MRAYIGAKIIQAEEMDEREFYMSVKIDKTKFACVRRPGYHVVYPDNYHSWSPKEVFEEAYRPVSDGEEELIMISKCNEPGEQT